MKKRLGELYEKYREWIWYLIFGIATTAVNFALYFPLYNFLGLSAALSNVIAWLAAVILAFFVNKRFVFCSKDWSLKAIGTEGLKFAACRIGSGLVETGLIFLTVDWFSLNGNLWKVIISILVVVLNYFGSKLFVFPSA